MAATKDRISFNVRRLGNFLKLFLRNKRGFIGLVIIFLFCLMGLGSELMTPYNQLGTLETRTALAGSMVAPAWVKILPSTLGGNPTLSENVVVVDDPTFASPDWQWPLGEWNVTTPSTAGSTLSIGREGGGRSGNESDGCVGLSYRRNGSQTPGDVKVLILKAFDYPYVGRPAYARIQISLILNGTMHQEVRKVWNSARSRYDTLKIDVPDVPARISLILVNSTGYVYHWWPDNNTYAPYVFNATLFAEKFNIWEDVDTKASTTTSVTGSGSPYMFGVEILLPDYYYNASREVEFTARIDNVGLKFFGMCWGILGTNWNGYDLWAQLVYGARISLYVGILTALLSVGIGLIVGLASGYLGKMVDELLMRATDVLLVLPGLPLLIVLFAVLGATIENLIILLGLLGWMGFAKVVRSQVLSLRERSYIEAAKAAGAGTGHILIKHVMPNVMGLVYVTLATSVPGAIVAEAALSWLGFYDPFRMSWGRMLQEMNAANAAEKWWWVIPPGLCIAAISIAFVLLGYALDEVLNPKLRQRR